MKEFSKGGCALFGNLKIVLCKSMKRCQFSKIPTKKNMSRHFCFSTPKDFLFSASIISYIPFLQKRKNMYAYIIFDGLPIFYEMSVKYMCYRYYNTMLFYCGKPNSRRCSKMAITFLCQGRRRTLPFFSNKRIILDKIVKRNF